MNGMASVTIRAARAAIGRSGRKACPMNTITTQAAASQTAPRKKTCTERSYNEASPAYVPANGTLVNIC